MQNRRSFLTQASLMVAGTQAGLLLPFGPATARAAAWFQQNNDASASGVVVETAYGKIRGTAAQDIKIFKGISRSKASTGDAPETHALAAKVSAAWIAFARTGNPNTPQLPRWPVYAAVSRETMVFNHVSRVVKDPDREQRLIMEQVLKLS